MIKKQNKESFIAFKEALKFKFCLSLDYLFFYIVMLLFIALEMLNGFLQAK